MRNVHIDYQGEALNYQSASLLAKGVARENQMQEPTIMAWHRQGETMPYYDGADPDTWWAKYGAGNGGGLEINVGDKFQFVMMDTGDFETLDQIPLRNLADAEGNEYICYTPMLKSGSAIPNDEACMPLDDWLADQL